MTIHRQADAQEMECFQWRPNRGVLLFVAVFLPITIFLGFWQLGRAAEKQAMLEDYLLREKANAVDITRLDIRENQQNRRVFARGTFNNDRTILLDNRVRHGRPGYEVVTQFKPAGFAHWIWVNRGWVEASPDRRILPDIPVMTGEVSVRGYLYATDKQPYVVGEETWRDQWPQVLQNLDLTMLSQRLDTDFLPYQWRLDQDSRAALETGWPVVNVMPEKHTAYAVQWFSMATALVVLCLFANSNLAVVLKQTFSKSSGKQENE